METEEKIERAETAEKAGVAEGVAETTAWPRCPEAADFFESLFQEFTAANESLDAMAARFRADAGVLLKDLIDHWTLPDTPATTAHLAKLGLLPYTSRGGDAFWQHPAARLPRVRLHGLPAIRMAIGVEELQLFAECNDLPFLGQHGDPEAGYQEVRYPLESGELAALVRRGYGGFQPGSCSAHDERKILRARKALQERTRVGDDVQCAQAAGRLLESLAEDVEIDRLVDEFFQVERDYYMRTNSAARWQYCRQQGIGIGWANHDHHTYRSSRTGFRSLMQLWEQVGFVARERFYAGAEAGWGAQILEHPTSRVVLFCDVDVSPDEIDIDFASVDLQPLDSVRTIGLWCGLHSDSIAAAGLHHLEAEFDYALVRSQFERGGHAVMPPFTDLDILKQAFTEAEIWQVDPLRAEALRNQGLITGDQYERFVKSGAPGSHLEILQRRQGFKGFNKTGVSAIIRKTDARN